MENDATRLQELHHEALRLLSEDPLPYDDRMRRFCSPQAYEEAMAGSVSGYYGYLGALVRASGARRVLELGSCEGGSALFMLLSLPEDGRLVTVDVAPTAGCFLGPCLEDPRLEILIADTLAPDTLDRIAMPEVDLLFVDTLHTYAQVSAEWERYRPLLAPGGIAAFDDIRLDHEMRRFWDELPEPKLDTGERFHHSGFGIVLKPG